MPRWRVSCRSSATKLCIIFAYPSTSVGEPSAVIGATYRLSVTPDVLNTPLLLIHTT